MRGLCSHTPRPLAACLWLLPASLMIPAGCGDEAADAGPVDAGPVAQVAEPARVEVSLSPRRGLYSLDDTPSVIATAFDRQDAPVETAVVWSVDPAEAGDVSAGKLHFVAEGPGIVRACAGDLCGEAAFFVDHAPPTLEVLSPARGASFSGAEAATIHVHGSASDTRGDVDVRVNGARVPVDDEGGFDAEVPARFGVNTIEVTADDGVRDPSSDVRDVLWAERYAQVDEDGGVDVPLGITLQLDQEALDGGAYGAGQAPEAAGGGVIPEGAGTVILTAASDMVEALLSLADVHSLLPELQLADNEMVSLRVDAVSLGQPEVDVFLTDTGIELFLGLPAVAVQTSGWAVAGGAEVSLDGVVEMNLAAYATLAVSFDGELHVSLSDAGVAVGTIEGHYDDAVASALVNSAGGTVGELVNGVAEDLTDALLQEQLPGLVDATIDSLLAAMADIPIALPPTTEGEPGLTLVVGLTPASFTLSPRDAMVLAFDARIAQPPVQAPYPDPGVPLLADEALPLLPSGGLAMEVRIALLNTLLHEVWRGGLLRLTPALPEGMSGLLESVTVDAGMAPIIVPGDDEEGLALELQLGDLRLAVDAAIGEGVDHYALSFRVPVAVQAVGGKLQLSLPGDLGISGTVLDSGGEQPLLDGEQIANLIADVVWPEVQAALDGGLAFGVDPIPLPADSFAAITPRLSGVALNPQLGGDLLLIGDRLRLEGRLELELSVTAP